MMRALFTACIGLLVLALVASGTNLWFSSEDANALESPLSFHPSQAGARIAALPEEKVLVIAMSSDIETMDPAKTSAMYGPPGMIYETLITKDLTGAYRPGLAEWWDLNTTDPDHPTFEIRLQQGVKFHDNTSFDSNAVKRIINYYSDNNSWVQYEFWAIYGCQNKTGWPNAGIWCKDSYNLVFNLTWADVALQFNLSHLYGSMMSPDALESDGLAHYGTPGHSVIGTGPFMLQEWIPGDHVTLVKNADYDWGAAWYLNKGPATIDRIIYVMTADEATRFAYFESGQIDVLQQVPPNKVLTYAANSEVTVITGPGQGTYHMEFNCQKAPWTSVSLRKAFGFAIDRTQILQSVWHGYGEEGVNYLPPIEPEGRLIPHQYNFSYDLAESATLFEQAGYQNRDSDQWLEKSDMSELTLNLWTTTKGEDIAMSEILQAQFQAVGVHVQLAMYTETQLRDKAAAGEQDAILFWYSWPRAEILDWHFGTWAAGGSNTGWYMDSVFDDYATNWTYATTEKEFSDNATAGHIRLLTQGPWAPILFWHQIDAVHNDVTGWYVHPIGREQAFNILDVDVSTPSPPADTVAPSTTLSITGTLGLDGRYTSPVSITLTSLDDTSGVASTFYQVDSENQQTYSGSFSISEEGAHIVYFHSVDNAGNVEGQQHVYVDIDTQPPTTPVQLHGTLGANGWYVGDSVSVELLSGDYGSYVNSTKYRIDNGTWQTYSGSRITVDKEGTTVIDYYAIDAAGNVEPQKSVSFKLDSTGPAIAFTYPLADSKISKDSITIEWSGADYVSEIDHYEVQVDGGTWIPFGTATSFELRGLQDKWHSVTVKALDKSGNNATATVSFGIYTSIWSQNGPHNGIPLYALIAGVIVAALLGSVLIQRRMKRAGPPPEKSP